jgi:hypothetical protein
MESTKTMKRSELILPAYFDRYILKADDVPVMECLQISLDELRSAPWDVWKSIGDAVYAPGKWTIKELLQHLIDTERIFTYRALAFARGEKSVNSYDEDAYATASDPSHRSLDEMMEEAIDLRQATIGLFRSFSRAMLEKSGMGFKGEFSVHSIGYIIGGHQRWHFGVIEERYRPLMATG